MIIDFGRMDYYIAIAPYKNKLVTIQITKYLIFGGTLGVSGYSSIRLIAESTHLDNTRINISCLRALTSILRLQAEMKPAIGAFT